MNFFFNRWQTFGQPPPKQVPISSCYRRRAQPRSNHRNEMLGEDKFRYDFGRNVGKKMILGAVLIMF